MLVNATGPKAADPLSYTTGSQSARSAFSQSGLLPLPVLKTIEARSQVLPSFSGCKKNRGMRALSLGALLGLTVSQHVAGYRFLPSSGPSARLFGAVLGEKHSGSQSP